MESRQISLKRTNHKKLLPSFYAKNKELKEFQIAFLNEYLNDFPELRDHFCFLDCGVASQSIGVELTYLLFRWSNTELEPNEYQQLLLDLEKEFGFSAYTNKLFMTGTSISSSNKYNEHMVYEFVDESVGESQTRLAQVAQVNSSDPILLLDTHEDQSKYPLVQSSSEQLEEYLTTYAKSIFANSDRIYSRFGKPLQRLVVFPLIVFNESETERSTTFMAGVFAGFDDSEDLKLDLIYHVLSNFAALSVGTPFVSQNAEIEGSRDVVRLIAHQFATIAGKVKSGWLLSKAQAEEFVSSSPEDYSVAPLPALYEAMGTWINLWSLAISEEELFPEKMRKQQGSSEGIAYPPATMKDLACWAAYLASQSTLCGRCEGLIMSNSTDLKKASSYIAELKDIYKKNLVFKCDEATLHIKLDRFMHEDVFQLDRKGKANKDEYTQLSGVVRILIVLFENWLQHSPGTNLSFFATYERSVLTIEVSNAKKISGSNENLNISKASHAGSRGYEQAIETLRRCFLRNNPVSIFKDETGVDITVKCTIASLDWIEK